MLDISEQVRWAGHLRGKLLSPLTNRFRDLSLTHTPGLHPLTFEYQAGKHELLVINGKLLGALAQCADEQFRVLEAAHAVSLDHHS